MIRGVYSPLPRGGKYIKGSGKVGKKIKCQKRGGGEKIKRGRKNMKKRKKGEKKEGKKKKGGEKRGKKEKRGRKNEEKRKGGRKKKIVHLFVAGKWGRISRGGWKKIKFGWGIYTSVSFINGINSLERYLQSQSFKDSDS